MSEIKATYHPIYNKNSSNYKEDQDTVQKVIDNLQKGYDYMKDLYWTYEKFCTDSLEKGDEETFMFWRKQQCEIWDIAKKIENHIQILKTKTV